MFIPKDHTLTMRCPVCFNREIDVLMKLDANDGKYKCQKCSYHGTEETTREYYKYLQKKFQWINKRVTIEDYDKI